ncbi:hypothetical protein PR048_027819 [Dryococelus australis]|uniref:Uncharacterized protein n=1 Tax=Dryococelus australis TaxID=614101 RepID=A0ABQ9GHL8_9NEOP|nr:hypothetical protein PR048_027819 [Dryococelus australis]
MWHEAEGARGGNQIATCVCKVTLLSDDRIKCHIWRATIFLFAVQENQSLNIFYHKFLVSGHSHMKCDVNLSMTENQKEDENTSDTYT